MSQELTNVALLKDAYGRWNGSKGASVDHWLEIVDPNIKFGSLARGAPPVAEHYTGVVEAEISVPEVRF